MGGRGVILGLVAVVPVALAGCSSPPGHRGVATDGVARRVTVYYATDRAATSREDPEAVEYGWKRAYLEGDRPYELGVCKVEITRERNHDKIAPLPHMGNELVRLISTSALERSEFYGRLREKMWNAGANETFVFVHGFNNDFESAAQRTAELWYDLGFEGPPIMFSWASRGWRGLFGYLADEETIEWSAVHLKKFLQELAAETSAQKLLGYQPARIHLIGHSMGCRAVTDALALIAQSGGSAPSSAMSFSRPLTSTGMCSETSSCPSCLRRRWPSTSRCMPLPPILSSGRRAPSRSTHGPATREMASWSWITTSLTRSMPPSSRASSSFITTTSYLSRACSAT